MEYKVIISTFAKWQMKEILYPISCRLKNPEAARRIKQDMKETKTRLSYLAENFKLCEPPEMVRFGYRIIFFQRHRYIMLYRVVGNTVYVDGIFHELQNYHKLFK